MSFVSNVSSNMIASIQSFADRVSTNETALTSYMGKAVQWIRTNHANVAKVATVVSVALAAFAAGYVCGRHQTRKEAQGNLYNPMRWVAHIESESWKLELEERVGIAQDKAIKAKAATAAAEKKLRQKEAAAAAAEIALKEVARKECNEQMALFQAEIDSTSKLILDKIVEINTLLAEVSAKKAHSDGLIGASRKTRLKANSNIRAIEDRLAKANSEYASLVATLNLLKRMSFRHGKIILSVNNAIGELSKG